MQKSETENLVYSTCQISANHSIGLSTDGLHLQTHSHILLQMICTIKVARGGDILESISML